MQGIILYVRVLGLILLMSFGPILTIGLSLSRLSFWPFTILQTLALILVSGSLLTWYVMRMCYEHSSLTWTLYPPYSIPQRMRLLISSPLRKPYVLFQIQQGNYWMTNNRCDLTVLPLSTADQENLTIFLEDIPTLDDQTRVKQAFDYICDQFGHEPFTRIYMKLSGNTQNKI